MMVLSQAPGGALSARQYGHRHHTSSRGFSHKKPPPFSTTNSKKNSEFLSRRRPFPLTITKAEGGSGVEPTSATKQPFPTNSSGGPTPPPPPPPSFSAGGSDTVFVGQEDVPLEGVIQFEKPPSSSSSRLDRWGRVALLAGGDVLALLLFSAIGRFSHGLSAFDYETLRTADPFIAGWFLGAYFLGGYGEDGRGTNGPSKAIIAAAKSWAVGMPLGIIIRGMTSGHIPPYTFILVTMGSTAILLIGWRALSSRIFPSYEHKKDDMYRQGNPFELFELLTSLIRRW